MSRAIASSSLLGLDRGSGVGLQEQIRQKLIEAVLSGALAPGRRLPSSRVLGRQLGVASNTVVLACQQLVADGYLVARERSGLFVNDEIVKGRRLLERVGPPVPSSAATGFQHRFKSAATGAEHRRISPDWEKYPYPFLEGRFDRSLFPVAEWREANRLALRESVIHHWATDSGDADDPLLIEEIRTKVLPRRGIRAEPAEILITAGTEQALHLLSEMFADKDTTVALEEPGNPSMRQLLARRGARLHLQPVDDDGLAIDERLDACDLVYVTPSHQRPTAATLSLARRTALLQKAAAHELIVIEDDFECETNYLDDAYPALRGMPGGERVVYVASLSRVLAPGLRLGFLVAAPEIVAEARRLRTLVARHPPLNNQRTAALFIALGHYDTTMLRIGRVFRERLLALRDALNHYRPQPIAIAPVRGGTTYWVRGPEGLDARDLARAAEARGVLIEPVDAYYASGQAPANVFRMGVTGIPAHRIRDGVAMLAETIAALAGGRIPHLDLAGRDWLRAEELRRVMAGATLLYKTVYGEPCTIELMRDGTMAGRAGYANEDRDDGRWWIEDDRWFRQWKGWAYGEASGYLTRIEGDRVQWFNAQGRLVDSAILVKTGPDSR
jgi:GntR family transcriptional regulator/MocR family aminotransferase